MQGTRAPDQYLVARKRYIITARIRRMEEGTVFSLFVSSHLGGGGYPSQVWGAVYNLALARSPVASPFLCRRVEFRSTRPVWQVEILAIYCCHPMMMKFVMKQM